MKLKISKEEKEKVERIAKGIANYIIKSVYKTELRDGGEYYELNREEYEKRHGISTYPSAEEWAKWDIRPVKRFIKKQGSFKEAIWDTILEAMEEDDENPRDKEVNRRRENRRDYLEKIAGLERDSRSMTD